MKYLSIITITSFLHICGARSFSWESYYGYPHIHYPYYSTSLTPGQKRWVIDREQRNELPILNPRQLDPNLLMVCDDSLSPDDIYTGLVAVLVRIEDILRRNRCSRANFAIHRYPINVHTLLGKLRTTVSPQLERHPILGTYLDTMKARASQLIHKAQRCQLDYVLLMKVIRMSMKLLVNRIMCGFVEVDVLRNRYGWPSKYDTRIKHRMPYMSAMPAAPYYNGPIYPYTRYHPYSNRLHHHMPYASSLAPKMIPTTDTGGRIEPVQKWPYYPPYDAPDSPYLGALGPDGRQLNGVDSGCKTCDKNRDVIYP